MKNLLVRKFLIKVVIFMLPSIAILGQTAKPNLTKSKPIHFFPIVDHHQHLFSSTYVGNSKLKQIQASDVISLLDSANIKKGVLLSVAYS